MQLDVSCFRHKSYIRTQHDGFFSSYSISVFTTMCLQDLMRELYAKADARRPLPTRREKDVPRGPIPFSLDELESYLEHFKTCRYVHFPDPQVRYYRKFSRTCRLHADYVASFDEVRMIDICCGERIPECDYVKLGEEEKRCKCINTQCSS